MACVVSYQRERSAASAISQKTYAASVQSFVKTFRQCINEVNPKTRELILRTEVKAGDSGARTKKNKKP